MPRLSPYLGLALALAVGVPASILLLEYSAPVGNPVIAPAISQPAIFVVHMPTSAPVGQQSAAATSSHAFAVTNKTTTLQQAVHTKEANPASAQPSVPVAHESVSEAPLPAPLPPTNSNSESLRAALVNIMCYASGGSGLHSISGSGVFISSQGIILTNAHIAQYFLLSDKGASCVIRTGSPAVDAYKAALIFISPVWLRENATVLTQTLPTGTGEYDFALLAVTSSVTSAPLPQSFPAVQLAQVPPVSSTPVVIASFGAQFLSASQIRSNLSPTVVFGSVKNVFTFGTSTVDVLSLGGSAAAQEGSSGGGVVNANGTLVGMITTSTVTGDTDTRVLSAITASYIRSEFAREMGSPIELMLSEPAEMAVQEFSAQIPALEAIITAQFK